MSDGALERLASAVARIEDHRGRLLALRATADDLAECDVVVVVGEHAVLSALEDELAGAHRALAELVRRPDDHTALQRFETVAHSAAWSVLDTVHDLLVEKQKIAELARRQVQARLAGWAELSTRVATLTQEIQDRHLYVAEPRELAATRSRMDALLRQANNGYKEDQLVDAWRALVELELSQPVPPAEVPDRLEELIGRAQAARVGSGRLQLTALRGPLDQDRYEYTFMLLTPTGDRHIGINVQDSSTIVRGDRQYFLQQAEAASLVSYQALRGLRDGRPPAELSLTSSHRDTLRNLRTMGQVLYRLLIPDRMKEELDRHPRTPITIITNDLEIPWELMVTEGFLALERPIARMPVGRARARHTAVEEVRHRRRRVALIASTGQANELEGAVREVLAIASSLRSTWADDVRVDTFGTGDDEDPTGEQFRDVLVSSNYDIIHYAGHAVFDRVHPDQSGLLLADAEICFAQKIQRLLEGSPLVFLNACESARLRGAGAAGYQDDPNDGLASAFVYGGALACIGTMWPVLDAEAADFAIAFYNAVLEGHLLGEAMRLARVKAAEASPDDPSWASFVLYGDPTFSLDTPGRVDPTATSP